ncbi:MAG: bis(5'-nucleosyl)-tetraphosphatase (symmetrical) YqeK [Mogibacterium sp.]|nr:bis(5'-nucleosyl)-tetraphosphatase (symmetrical) YqeK [Mogibacterium sp.]
MSIICTDRDRLEAFMKAELNEKRYIHSLGVEEMAVHLAEIHGADVEKARFAGRYHDIAKCFTTERMNEYVLRYSLGDEYIDNPALAHSKVAAAILCNEYGVQDEDLLNAVKSHTTGRAEMSLLEEIVYVADAIEPNRDYPSLKTLQKLAESDLDGCCIIILDFTVDMVRAKGREVDKTTLNARDYMLEKINKKDGR